ncbi:TRAFAC clade GTPase domain-containing protein [Saccharopolyspora taberi]|uniref:Double-GTPase 2 domain-containing protein n=1 Tax=Saccharopolyspora taberi TaxID=60895 RepID=A0ABN3VJC2_9PSEU
MHPVVLLVAVGMGCFAAFILLYVAFFAASLGSLAGIAWAFVMACMTLTGRTRWQPALVTPQHVVTGTAGLPRLRGDKPYGRDWAWPNYLVAQWRYDWLAVWTALRHTVSSGYQRILDWRVDFQNNAVRWAVLAVPFAAWTGVTAGLAIGTFIVTVVCGVALVIAWGGWGAVIGVLRAYDGTVRRIRKADAVCPHPQCYYKQNVPDYKCFNCGRVHRDIRPGLLGAVWRRCGCEARLPTTVLRAARKLTALCERCERPLRTGSAAVTGVALPVFGPVSAGKTRLVYAGLVKLRDELAAAGAALEFDDESGRQAFDDGTRLVTDGGNTAKTPAGQLPAAITARVRRKRREALVNLFDAAGEFFADREDNTELEFLDHARGLVFVVDPFSIPWVQDQLGGAKDPRVVAAQPASKAPEDVYQVTVRRLKDYQVALDRRALAIVVVKADLLGDLPWARQLLSGAVREWLNTAGLDNLVLAAQRDFAKTRFFVTSSVTGIRPGSALSPAEPFLWLIRRGGFSIPRGRNSRSVEESA